MGFGINSATIEGYVTSAHAITDALINALNLAADAVKERTNATYAAQSRRFVEGLPEAARIIFTFLAREANFTSNFPVANYDVDIDIARGQCLFLAS